MLHTTQNVLPRNSHRTNHSNLLKERISFVEVDDDTLAALDEYRPALEAALPGDLPPIN